jgi:hypothetical protein
MEVTTPMFYHTAAPFPPPGKKKWTNNQWNNNTTMVLCMCFRLSINQYGEIILIKMAVFQCNMMPYLTNRETHLMDIKVLFQHYA